MASEGNLTFNTSSVLDPATINNHNPGLLLSPTTIKHLKHLKQLSQNRVNTTETKLNLLKEAVAANTQASTEAPAAKTEAVAANTEANTDADSAHKASHVSSLTA